MSKEKPKMLPVDGLREREDMARFYHLQDLAALPDAAEGGESKDVDVVREWAALVASVAQHGVLEPIAVVEMGDHAEIADGRHRFRAAKEAGLTAVPVRFVSSEEANLLILTSTANRRRWNKSMIAYMAVLTHPNLIGAPVGKPSKTNPQKMRISQEELAKRVAVSTGTIANAVTLAAKFNERPDLKAKYEIQLFRGDCLSGILSGIGFDEAKERGEIPDDKPKYSVPSASREFGIFRQSLLKVVRFAPGKKREEMKQELASRLASVASPRCENYKLRAVLREVLDQAESMKPEIGVAGEKKGGRDA